MMTNFSGVWEPVSTVCRSASSYGSSTLLRISVASSMVLRPGAMRAHSSFPKPWLCVEPVARIRKS